MWLPMCVEIVVAAASDPQHYSEGAMYLALRAHTQAHAMRCRRFGGDHVETAGSYACIGQVLLRQRR